MKLRDFIGSRNVVGITANAFHSPIFVGCGSGGCGSGGSTCGGSRGCGFTIVACGHSSCGGGGGCSSYSYHHFGGCGYSSCGVNSCMSYGCGGGSSSC